MDQIILTLVVAALMDQMIHFPLVQTGHVSIKQSRATDCGCSLFIGNRLLVLTVIYQVQE